MAFKPYCQCGCGQLTGGGKFRPGHDAKLKSRLFREMAAGDERAMTELEQRGWLNIGRKDLGSDPRLEQRQQASAAQLDADAPELEKVIDRIQKCLALADRAGTPDEANAAAGMAQRMAFKYNLDLDRIREKTGEKAKYITKTVNTPTGAEWLKLLLHSIARFNMCRMVNYPDQPMGIVVGEEHNIRVVEYLFKYLYREINRFTDIAWKEVCERYPDPDDWYRPKPIKWKLTFRQGACRGVHQQLQEINRADRQTDEHSLALTVRVDAELDQALQQFFPNLQKGRSMKIDSSSDAYWRGVRAGESIRIRPGVGSDSTAEREGRLLRG